MRLGPLLERELIPSQLISVFPSLTPERAQPVPNSAKTKGLKGFAVAAEDPTSDQKSWQPVNLRVAGVGSVIELSTDRLEVPGNESDPTSFDRMDVNQPEPEYLTEPEIRRRERENLVVVLQKTGWKIKGADGAAELLGVKPSTLNFPDSKNGFEEAVE